MLEADTGYVLPEYQSWLRWFQPQDGYIPERMESGSYCIVP